jgi:maltooligosyltrehalose synthase
VGVRGPNAQRLFAFARSLGPRRLVVVVPRLLHGLVDPAGRVSTIQWDHTAVDLPSGEWRELLTGVRFRTPGEVGCDRLLAALPFAVLHQERA